MALTDRGGQVVERLLTGLVPGGLVGALVGRVHYDLTMANEAWKFRPPLNFSEPIGWFGGLCCGALGGVLLRHLVFKAVPSLRWYVALPVVALSIAVMGFFLSALTAD